MGTAKQTLPRVRGRGNEALCRKKKIYRLLEEPKGFQCSWRASSLLGGGFRHDDTLTRGPESSPQRLPSQATFSVDLGGPVRMALHCLGNLWKRENVTKKGENLKQKQEKENKREINLGNHGSQIWHPRGNGHS